ncbi:MAG: diguanylate cyclase [Planctomycetes bacterium]|nr:diguanylate cyclase [Planctomycetota bacterium]
MHERILKPSVPLQRRVRVGEDPWRDLVESLPDPVLVVDRAGLVLFANRAARELGEGRTALKERLVEFDPEVSSAQELELGADDGSVLHLEARSSPLRWQSDRAWAVVLRNVTRRKVLAERMRVAAETDDLTGLPNRSSFLQRLHAADRRRRREPTTCYGVIFVDLDRFKAINDRYGHATGDLVLGEVGKRLRRCLRDGDLVARIGGDEFVVLLEDLCDDALAQRVAERIRAELDQPLRLAGLALRVEASLGVALSSQVSGEPNDVLDAADRAMYRSKQTGKVVYAKEVAPPDPSDPAP